MSDPHLNTLALGMDLTGRTVRNFQGKGFLQSVALQERHATAPGARVLSTSKQLDSNLMEHLCLSSLAALQRCSRLLHEPSESEVGGFGALLPFSCTACHSGAALLSCLSPGLEKRRVPKPALGPHRSEES